MSFRSSPAASARIVTELDHVRILQLVRRHDGPELLEDMVDAADLVPSRDVPADVVTMNSRVVVAGVDGAERQLTVCYPPDTDAATGRVSVLSPVGTALLGQRVGATAQWSTPGRPGTESLRIVAVAFQPEASGDYLA